MADEGSDQEVRKTLHMIQSMIDVSAQRLEGLRTQCATSAELTQQEIRTLEVMLLTKLLICKLKRGEKDCNDTFDLHWDSWVPDHHHQVKTGLSPRPGRSRAARTSVPCEESIGLNNNNNNRGGAIIPPSSSVSSIDTLNAQCNVLGPPLTPPGQGRGKGSKFPTTPPARRRHQTGIPPSLLPEYPLTKSKSHESQLASPKGETEAKAPNGTGSVGRRGRLPTEPGPNTMGYSSPLTTSPIKSPPYNHTVTSCDSDDNSYKSISLQVPKSPRTPTVMGKVMTHQIKHRFTKTFKMMSSCGYCQKPIYFGSGLKCKECKYTCHRDCEDKVTPSCGLPPELLNEFKKTFPIEAGNPFVSPTTGRASTKSAGRVLKTRPRKNSHPQPTTNTPAFPPHDSSSNTSSCNSSTPSSPAVQTLTTPHSSQKSTFHFPDVTLGETTNEVKLETYPLPPMPIFHRDIISSQQSTDTDRTASQTSESASTDSDKTPVRVDSQDSQVSDSDTITDPHRWPRQNSGMGYLHAKGIIHKDLKSKNIFVENGKVVIADFGLFSVTKLCFGNRRTDSLGIPPGWLCYLSPEIMRSLHAHQPHDEELPFSKASDVYAFGTVWYELLCGEWPFKAQPPEAVIWQVGKGMKQPLANLQASRDVKDILMLCWSFHSNDRPDFIRLLNILDKLPKKRLARSPSHPIHLSRSAESVF
uniref:Kinase suppressor of Ras 1-like n=1 Tax=Diabrotica virgifera virgifera TaxID=50390 RepID=A0A6P7GD17_DIAVI